MKKKLLVCPPNHRTWRRASTQMTRKSILSLDTNLKTKGIYQCCISPRSQETSKDSSDDDTAYTDEPLADAEWIEKYQEEMKANEELKRSLKDRLQGNVELKEW